MDQALNQVAVAIVTPLRLNTYGFESVVHNANRCGHGQRDFDIVVEKDIQATKPGGGSTSALMIIKAFSIS